MVDFKNAVQGGFRKLGIEVQRARPRLSTSAGVPDFAAREVRAIEESIDRSATRDVVFRRLRSLTLTDFGLLMLSMPNAAYPMLSSVLPRMASQDIQVSWTGDYGVHLLAQTLDFVRSVSYYFARNTGRSIDNARILDFGCGYGRILRAMYYFSDEHNVWGVDPWDRSIEICHADGLTKNVLLSDYLPSTLPVPADGFDLIYAFSVFTHLSERATLTCLRTLSKYIKTDGLLAVTIRPVEYWEVDRHAGEQGACERQRQLHNQDGFSFLPHKRAAVDGDVTYGDTTMTVEWLQKSFPDLKVVGRDWSLSDPYQIYVYLQKR